MGSDMAMEIQSFRPRPVKVFWEWVEQMDDHQLVVTKDYPISGYARVFENFIDENDEVVVQLLKVIGVGEIPPKPEKVRSKRQQVEELVSSSRHTRYDIGQIVDEIMDIFEIDEDKAGKW